MSLVSSVRKWQELEQFSSNFSLYYELQFAPGKNIWSNYLQDHSYSVNIFNNLMSIIFHYLPTIQDYSVNIFNNSMSIIFQQFRTIQWIYSTIQCQLSSNNSGLFSEYIQQFNVNYLPTIQDYSVNIFNNSMSIIFQQFRTIQWIYIQQSNVDYLWTIQENSVNIFNNPLSVIFNNSRLFSEYIQQSIVTKI